MTGVERRSGRRSGRVEHEAGRATEFVGVYATKAPESNAARRTSRRVSTVGPERRAKRTPQRLLERIDHDLSERERAILTDLDRYKFLTTIHLQALHFPNHRTASAAARLCRRALFRLAQLGVIEHLERRVGGIHAGSASYVWRVGPVGDRLLRRDREAPRARRKEPSPRHLDHSLAIADCYVALVTAARAGRFDLIDVWPEPTSWRSYLRSGAVREVLKPDLYAVLGSGDFEDHWFIEIDRATESLPTIIRKCSQYERYRRAGQEQQAIGVFPLVIWVLPDERHLKRLRDAVSTDRNLDRELYRVTTMAQFVEVVSGAAS